MSVSKSLFLTGLQLVLITQLLVVLPCCLAQKKCPPAPGRTESCVCQTEKGIIDLTPYSNGFSDGPRFPDLHGNDGWTYFYNPCQVYNAGGQGCDSVYICQEAGLFSWDIANDGTETMFIGDDGIPFLAYVGYENRIAMVFLYCNESMNTTAAADGFHKDGDSPQNEYFVFNITGKGACPKKASTKPGGGGGGGAGPGGNNGGQGLGLGVSIGIGVVATVVLAAAVIIGVVVAIAIYRHTSKKTGYERVN